MITIIGSGDPMPTKSVSEPWAKAGVMNIEYTSRISQLGPRRAGRGRNRADYSGQRPNCNAARRPPTNSRQSTLRAPRWPAKGAAQAA
jgi:hypothetical protein